MSVKVPRGSLPEGTTRWKPKKKGRRARRERMWLTHGQIELLPGFCILKRGDKRGNCRNKSTPCPVHPVDCSPRPFPRPRIRSLSFCNFVSSIVRQSLAHTILRTEEETDKENVGNYRARISVSYTHLETRPAAKVPSSRDMGMFIMLICRMSKDNTHKTPGV